MINLNRKGFTLVELLAVVVILLAISVIAISSISAAIERSKKKQNDAKISVIVSYAELYYRSNKNSLNNIEKGCIDLSLLDLSESESVDADGNVFNGLVIYTDNGKKFVYDTRNTCPY